MNRSAILIIISICLALIAGVVNFEVLSDPLVTIANEKGDMQLFVYFFFLGIAMTVATVIICIIELISLIKSQMENVDLPEVKKREHC